MRDEYARCRDSDPHKILRDLEHWDPTGTDLAASNAIIVEGDSRWHQSIGRSRSSSRSGKDLSIESGTDRKTQLQLEIILEPILGIYYCSTEGVSLYRQSGPAPLGIVALAQSILPKHILPLVV